MNASQAKESLANLCPVLAFFRYYKQLADKTSVNLQKIAKFAKLFPTKVFCYMVLQIITYVVVEHKENNGKVWQNHDASIGAAAVDEKTCLGIKQH